MFSPERSQVIRESLLRMDYDPVWGETIAGFLGGDENRWDVFPAGEKGLEISVLPSKKSTRFEEIIIIITGGNVTYSAGERKKQFGRLEEIQRKEKRLTIKTKTGNIVLVKDNGKIRAELEILEQPEDV